MRVGVIGAGAIGGVIAALLDRAGHEVELTARGAQLQAIRSGGLRLSGAWGEHLSRPRALETLETRPDLALLTTKAQDARAAAAANAGMLGGVPLVVVQNGLGGLESARAGAPEARPVGALALFAASYLTPGSVTVTAPGDTCLGGPDADAVRLAAEALGAVMPTSVVDDFAGAQWTKLVVNQLNALPAITGLSVQEVVADGGLRRLLTASMREAVRVGRAGGIRFAPLQGLSPAALAIVGRAPLSIGQLLPLAMARRMGSVPNPGSTLQSIRRGQPTEIDYLNGAIVAAAERAGVAAPVNAALTALVHEVERSGEHLSPARVLARTPLNRR